MVEGHKCYYCQGSLLYTFCEKYKDVVLSQEECISIMTELGKLDETIKKVEELEKRIADMEKNFV